MKKALNSPFFSLLLLIIVTTSIIGIRYQAILQNIHTQKTSDIYRDGIKTVLNATYHAKYSDSYSYFSGMNYPYKEHIVAATELPGFAILFKFLHPYFPSITDYSFGIIHAFLLLSILLGCIFLYLIFKELNIPWYLSIPAAIIITFLAPQNMRLTVHMGLAPIFVLPSILYHLLRLEKTRAWKYALYLCLFTFVASLLHFYFFAIIAIFVSIYFFIWFLEIVNWSKPFIKIVDFKNMIGYFSIGIGIPLLFFLFWMILNDPITDRSENPYGFFVYHTNFTHLFSSPHLPLYKWLNPGWFNSKEVDFEGFAYVGLVVDVFLIVLLSRWILSKFKHSIFNFFPDDIRPYLFRLLAAGGIMAYLSCSEPFINEGWEYLLQYTGKYKQFRSTGRFAWAFYFTINIIAFAGFYYLLKRINKVAIRSFILLLLISVGFYEAYVFHTNQIVYRDYNLRYAPELEPSKSFTDITDIDFTKYQAIIPSPLFLVGSNNIEKPGSAYIVQQALVLSNQTGLPVTGTMLTRSSHSQSLNQIQLVSLPYRKPIVFNDYPNNKPLILLVSRTEKPAYELQYGHLKDGAVLLHETERWQLYEVRLNQFKERISAKEASIQTEIDTALLYPFGSFLYSDRVETFVYQNFDHISGTLPYFTKGAYEGHVGRTNFLYIDTLPNARTDIEYTLQLWTNVSSDRFATAVFKIEEQLANGHMHVAGQNTPGWGNKLFDKDGWVMIEIPFRISDPSNKITVSFKKVEDWDMRMMQVDELLIKPKDAHLYQVTDSYIWKDNEHFVR